MDLKSSGTVPADDMQPEKMAIIESAVTRMLASMRGDMSFKGYLPRNRNYLGWGLCGAYDCAHRFHRDGQTPQPVSCSGRDFATEIVGKAGFGRVIKDDFSLSRYTEVKLNSTRWLISDMLDAIYVDHINGKFTCDSTVAETAADTATVDAIISVDTAAPNILQAYCDCRIAVLRDRKSLDMNRITAEILCRELLSDIPGLIHVANENGLYLRLEHKYNDKRAEAAFVRYEEMHEKLPAIASMFKTLVAGG